MPNIGNLNLLNVILPYGPAAQSGVVAYYPSYGNANRLVISGGGPVTTYYQSVQNQGSALPQELNLDFSTGLLAVDDPANGRTVVTAASGISYDQGLIVAPPLAAAWTLENANANTAIANSGKAGFPTIFFGAYDVSAETQSARLAVSPTLLPGSGGAYAMVARFRAFPTLGTSSPICGFFIENVAGQIITWNFQFNGSAVTLQVIQFTNYSTISSAPYSSTSYISPIASNWALIEHTTGSPGARNFYWSNDGVNFYKFYTQADTSFINNNETKIGLDVDQNGSAGSAMILESFAQDTSFANLITNGKIAPLATKHP